ncbi:PREDICTED: probable cytosolic Fe-S cluster assembly factor CPIJ010948 [Dinoponera quadriceps]|uniref:Probable cytosolic Fe-S cluster assembly factor CPIJ010948 n=1 Tax=Dinoponera quadriceps TaxID=609295 RepID=A0A6P3XDU6_DINQU|nr:PREDICTED: probable cytosolic Fe-S cluster assembly factor CPIJ010948 [Dinoponera quadriceps]XP_014476622.1 PREDICTED: probable cytosolic Fe-S cluster assembly factor CPIJ010948 [Dinoponera quadriceps]XP_014476623.1 PREDICTED: probable cytosolic Fe-S cluster assembly factor CPIJ010948 [Dinoponera quadriceps]XP_014476624.1 PREDICTED: probable cytosolic Fe-S cluster assembly factor CPIJ010948 [Dinoponera quadriceps]XP_014476625.1 PREDICTED: probable cytosolic Fe-S cluster assembly factor CPIJ0
MASRFSGALQITNLDDFITPSQECIKPIEMKSSGSKTGSKIKIQSDNAYSAISEIGQPEKLQKVEITLADCLACSGCITSAESVLVTQQSREELLRVFQEKVAQQNVGNTDSKYIVVSLSVQPVLSLAQRYELTPEQALCKLAGFFYRLGADTVLDMTMADDFALLEAAKEFVERYKANKEGAKDQLPMLSSSCPGWVCYAEKTHGNFILPYISITKSPQQIMGSLVKYHLAEIMGLSPEQVYHVTVMPCYDKKLEASREDFYNQQKETRDVDCVITSIELEQMLNEDGLILNEIDEGEIKQPFGSYGKEIENRLWGHSGSGSGGYADFIFRYAAKNLFDEESVTVDFKNLRNPDFQEAELKRNDQVLLKFAIINGFRNIQNIVQKMKRRKCVYDYVEIMACPCGCLNGGAQVRPEGNVQPRELASTLENMYHKLPSSNPEENKVIRNLYKTWLGGEHTDKVSAYFSTQYHEIQKMNTALAIKW